MIHHELETLPLAAFQPDPLGKIRLFKKDGGSAPSPDPNIGAAALKNAEIGEEWLKFAKEQFEIGNERQKPIDEQNQAIGKAMLDNMSMSNAMAKEQYQTYLDKYKPVEMQAIDEAMNYDSAERQNQLAAQARSDVVQNADVMRQAGERNMQRMGVSPTSGRYQENSAAMGLDTALGAAQAENAGRTAAVEKGMAMRAGIANMGRGLPNTSMAAMGTGNASGAGALNGSLAANGAWQSNQGIMGQGFQGAMAGNSSMANILNQQYSSQLQAWQAQQQANATSAGGLGSMVGMIGGAWLGGKSK